MKKLISLLLAVLMLLAVTAPAMAYAPVTPTNNPVTATATHTLLLTQSNASSLPYDITYTYTVTSGPQILLPSGNPANYTNSGLAVSGKPKIDPVKYTTGSAFDDNKKCTQNLVINWDDVSINEPGIYRWTLSKTMETNAPAEAGQPTNEMPTAYLDVYVTNATDGTNQLIVSSVCFSDAATIPVGKEALDNFNSTKGSVNDKYPAKTLDLTISKTVDGNQGSLDQYFKFSVSLTPQSTHPDYTITIYEGETVITDNEVPATAYHAATKNPTEISANVYSVDIWLKHNQRAVIQGLLYDTGYTVAEAVPAGYTVTIQNSDPAATEKAIGETTSTGLKDNCTIAFTNTKQATVPTGIELQTIAPIMGILLAAGMMMILFAGKKKETVR